MMLMRGLQILYFISIKTGQVFLVSLLFNTLGVFLFVFGSFLYLYVRGFINDESRFKKKDLIHFIPFLFALIDSIPWYFLDADTQLIFITDMIGQQSFMFKNSFGVFPQYVSSLLRNSLLLTYIIMTWRVVLTSGVLKMMKKDSIVTNWIVFFVVVTTVSNVIAILNSLVVISLGASSGNLFLGTYRVFIHSTILLVFFAYLLYNPRVLYGFVFVSKEFAVPVNQLNEAVVFLDNEEEKAQHVVTEKVPKVSRKSNVKTNEEEIDRIKEQMACLMETEKPFLNPDFSLGELASHVGLPQHHCSYILNEYFEKNFREWVNAYRVDFFIKVYPTLIASQTIVSIALASGFKNKNTFYSAFEKETGQTPSHYFSR